MTEVQNLAQRLAATERRVRLLGAVVVLLSEGAASITMYDTTGKSLGTVAPARP